MVQPLIEPLAEVAASEPDDLLLVDRVKHGSRDALETLLRRHQPWIYNIVLRMLYWSHDAEDVTQEILITVMTKLSSFNAQSSFRTWLYRIVINHVINSKRNRWPSATVNFESYAKALDATPDLDLPDESSMPVDARLLVEETQISCTRGMLLCLDRDQRMVYILGDILGVTDVVGAELLEITRENFRQRLARARRDLHSFMQDKCGLVNLANPCRCKKKTLGFIRAGYVDPNRLVFTREHLARVRQVAPDVHQDLGSLDERYGRIHREQPFHECPDFVQRLGDVIGAPEFKKIFEVT